MQDMTFRKYHNGELTRSRPYSPTKNNTETLDTGPGQLVFGRRYVEIDRNYGQVTFDEFSSWNKVLAESDIKIFCKC